ncbi:MAG: hypothetical protein NZ608_06935 [candidate division WOR-3 bacterium]|nr:hypothetical protein [candidate division WOR-3 bacterium]
MNEIEELWKEIREKAKKSFPFFLFNFVKTFDYNDKFNPVKNFPEKESFLYLAKEITKERFIAIPKSRQVMITWFICAYLVWRANFYPNYFIVVKSTKADKSGWGMADSNETNLMGDLQALLSRCYFIYYHLPEKLKTFVITSKRPSVIKFIHYIKEYEAPSIIMGATSNPEELRQYTINILFMDEVAFQKDARMAYFSTIPALTKDGQVILVSTPNGKEFFHNIVYDIEL